jgi:hypothetical protein
MVKDSVFLILQLTVQFLRPASCELPLKSLRKVLVKVTHGPRHPSVLEGP